MTTNCKRCMFKVATTVNDYLPDAGFSYLRPVCNDCDADLNQARKNEHKKGLTEMEREVRKQTFLKLLSME